MLGKKVDAVYLLSSLLSSLPYNSLPTNSRSVNAQVFHRSLSHLAPPLPLPSSSPPSSPSSASASSQQLNLNALLSLIQLPALSKLGVLGGRAQGKVPQTIRGIVLVQALYRGHAARQLYRRQQR